MPRISKSEQFLSLRWTLSILLLIASNVNCLAQKQQPQLPKIEKSPYKTIEEARAANVIEGVHISLKAPTNFPLPVYTSNIISTNFTNTTKGTPMADLTLLTKDDLKTVFEWYKAQCTSSGWQVRTPKQSKMSAEEKAGRFFILNAVKGEQQGTVTLSSSAKHPQTVINVVWMKHT